MTEILIACYHCNQKFNTAMRCCPFCGSNKKVVETNSPGECPRCKTPLQEILFRNEKVDICSTCDGLWLDLSEFDKLTSVRDTMTDTTIPYGYDKGFPENFVSYIPCPRCHKIMIRENFKRTSGVIIDRCAEHGVWFDARELQKIRQFVVNGGIEKSQDKAIEKSEIAISNLQRRTSDLELMEKILHKWDKRRFRFRQF